MRNTAGTIDEDRFIFMRKSFGTQRNLNNERPLVFFTLTQDGVSWKHHRKLLQNCCNSLSLLYPWLCNVFLLTPLPKQNRHLYIGTYGVLRWSNPGYCVPRSVYVLFYTNLWKHHNKTLVSSTRLGQAF